MQAFLGCGNQAGYLTALFEIGDGGLQFLLQIAQIVVLRLLRQRVLHQCQTLFQLALLAQLLSLGDDVRSGRGSRLRRAQGGLQLGFKQQ